jgi:hypothetical protein
VVGRHADVRRAGLDHLEHGVQDAAHGAERLVHSLAGTALPIEVAEQLVRTVQQVDDHGVRHGNAFCAVVALARNTRRGAGPPASRPIS